MNANRSFLINFLSCLLVIMIFVMCYCFYRYNVTYNSIKVVVSDKKKVEYGAVKYDINNVIDEVDGKIVSVVKDVDTNVIGKQEVILEVKKENIIREIPIIVEVVDTVAPVIRFKEESITITKGDTYNFLDNIDFVSDSVDGNLSYKEKYIVNDVVDTNYYTVVSNVDSNVSGEYLVTVKAVDKSGNVTTSGYKVIVEEPIVNYRTVLYNNLPANSNANQLVSVAYSLIGSPYISGANGPYAFDCSGFVQYVYAQVGISVSRSATTQINDGVGVSYDYAQPGDILSWGYVDGVATHSALYIGNGQMIHATNPTQGVIMSDVAAWTRGSGTRVIAVRRIQ